MVFNINIHYQKYSTAIVHPSGEKFCEITPKEAIKSNIKIDVLHALGDDLGLNNRRGGGAFDGFDTRLSLRIK